MKMKLELFPVPVTDIDRAMAFYIEKLEFNVDVDVQKPEGVRVVQLTPPGSACSIGLWAGLPEVADMQPGSARGLHLVVANVAEARATLAARGVAVGEVEDLGGGVKHVPFTDPDGNGWVLQEMEWRSPEFAE